MIEGLVFERPTGAGVLYIEDFDEPALLPALPPAEEESAAIIVPFYTLADIEAAREEGRAAALEDHAATHAALVQAALTSITDGLASSRDAAVTAAAQQAEEIASAILALLAACLPASAALLAGAEVGGLLAALLPPLSREPGVELRVHPVILPDIADLLGNMRDLRVHGDTSLTESDLRLSWRDGEARRDWTELWRGIATALPRFVLPHDWTMDALQALAAASGEAQHGG